MQKIPFNLDKTPRTKFVYFSALISFIVFLLTEIWVSAAFAKSGYPVGFIESQLSFSGEIIKSHFLQMSSDQISLYRIAQLIDYIFMVGYGSFLFFNSLAVSRLLLKDSWMKNIGPWVAIFGIVAICFDAFENLFILIMVANPLGFANVIAVIHSICALFKFLAFGSSLAYIFIGFVMVIVQRIKNNK